MTTTAAAKSRLGMEPLEQREVPSITSIIPSGSYLYVYTDHAATNVTVYQSGSNVQVYDGGTLKGTYASSWVGVYGGNGNDRFVNNHYSLPVSLYGYGGNDYLEGYNGSDYLSGGDGADILKGYGGNDTLSGGYGRDIVKGMAGNDYCYGDGNDDTVTGDDGNDYLSGGDGHDQITGGAGTDTLYGGYGDDSLVTIDTGTTDYADGQDGRDTVWRDMTVTWNWIIPTFNYDTAYAEKDQVVTGFANGADRTLDGDGIVDPTDGTFYKNFAANPLFGASGPSVNDIDQGDLADCWLMAPLGSMANDNQFAVRQTVADFGDGTYGVRLGNSFYRVDADLPTWGTTSTTPRFAGLGHDGGLWAAIIEKAYATHRTGANTYASLEWGFMTDAMNAYNLSSVGQNNYAAGSNSATVANDIYNRWNAFQSCTICTGSNTGTSGLVGRHCYSVVSVSRNASGVVTSITLRNPWGGSSPYVTLSPAALASAQIGVAWGNS